MSNFKQKKLLRYILLLSLVLVFSIAGVACASRGNTDALGAAELAATEDEEVVLYFNVDREEYVGKGADGLTGRTKDPDTGYYHISFAGKGRVSARRVLNMSLATKIDNQDVMALVLNEEGVVSDIITVDQCAGGYFMGGKHLYVGAVNGRTLTVYGNSDLVGSSYTMEYTADTKIYDVSEEAKESGTQGNTTDISANDKIVAVLNKDGSVGWIFVMDRVVPMETKTAYCQHCQQEVTWYGWNKDDSLPISGEGHYYLTEDVDCYGQMSMEKDSSIVLDLNGYTVTSLAGKRIYSLHNTGAYLAIMDTSEAGTGTMRPGATDSMTNEGACVWVRYGAFDLYSGTLDGSQIRGSVSGVTVATGGGTVFRMHGGKIIGGMTETIYNKEEKSYTGGLGGALYVKGTFEMSGGQISGGTSKGITVNGSNQRGMGGAVYFGADATGIMTGGTIVDGICGGRGGNVYLSDRCTFTMSDNAKIARGLAAEGGGNVYVAKDSTFTMHSSATISGGACNGKGKNGGSVYVGTGGVFNLKGGGIYGGSSKNCGGAMVLYGTLNMSGGTITGGKTLEYPSGKELPSNNENIFCVNGTINMYGGTIGGHVQLTTTGDNECKVLISGTSKIKGAEDGMANLFIPTGKTIDVDGMSEGAEVWVTGSGFFSTWTEPENAKYFHSDVPGASVVHYDNRLAIGRMQCDCGASVTGRAHVGDCDGELHMFAVWSKESSLPTTPGRYYLAGDVALTGQMALKTSGELILDLNGHKVTGADGKRIYALWTDCNVTLGIADSSAKYTGKMVVNGTGDEGRIIWVRTNHTVKLYGGTFDASNAVAGSGKNGVAIASSTKSTINMYGGTVIGGNAQSNSCLGGAVYIKNATFTMTGGTIQGGKAQKGGNVYIDSGATFNLTGGNVTGGASAGNAGNIWVGGGAKLNLGGGTVSGGTSKDSGGNIALYGTMNMTGGEIKGGTAQYINCQNVFVVNATLNMSGGTIAGHVYPMTTSSDKAFSINISGTAKITGGTSNLRIPKGKTINVGTMEDGAEIYIDMEAGTGVFSTGTDSGNEKYFHTQKEDHVVIWNDDGCLELFHGRYQCICGASVKGGDHIGDCNGTKYPFKAWTSTASLPTTTGNYYLTSDVTLAANGGQQAVKSDATINLDLNGKSVKRSGDGNRIYALWDNCNVKLNIADSAGNGKMTASGGNTNQGMIVWLKGVGHVLKLYGGTFDASAASVNTDTSAKNGAAISSENSKSGNEIFLYGGTIVGAKSSEHNGGAVYIKNATFTMTGGEIKGGNAKNGGNVYIDDNATFTMKGGTITGGTSTNNGGNVYVAAKGTFNLYGGTVKNGNGKSGGNVWNFGTLNMTGGTITGGKEGGNAGKVGANVSMIATSAATSKLVMSGGEIDGHVCLSAYTKLPTCEISGTAKVISSSSGTSGFYLNKDASNYNGEGKPSISIGEGFSGEIYVEVGEQYTPAGYQIATADKDAYRSNIQVQEGYFAFYENGGYTLYDSSKYRAQCVCGHSDHIGDCNGQLLLFQKWTNKTSLPTTTGNYYLDGDVTLTAQVAINPGANIVLDLNGKTVTSASDKRIYSTYRTGNSTASTLTILDSAGGGTMKATGEGDQGRIVWLAQTNHTLNLYGGTFDVSGATAKTSKHGVAIASDSAKGASINMYGGTIIGGDAQSKSCLGGAVYIKNATFTMTGGEIKGGNAKNGGNVYIDDNATFTMKDGTITGGTATSGANVYVAAGGKLDWSDGTIGTEGTDGIASAEGATVNKPKAPEPENNGGTTTTPESGTTTTPESGTTTTPESSTTTTPESSTTTNPGSNTTNTTKSSDTPSTEDPNSVSSTEGTQQVSE